MTKSDLKQGIPRVSNCTFLQEVTLPDTLPKTGGFHRETGTDRVSQGIRYLQKDRQGARASGQGAQGVLPPFIGNRYPGYPVAPQTSAGNPAKPVSKKAERRLKRRADAIAKWWATVPAPRPFFYTSAQLAAAVGLDMPRMAAALTALGWTRIHRRLNHRTGTYWLPPGSPIAAWPPYTPRHFACP